MNIEEIINYELNKNKFAEIDICKLLKTYLKVEKEIKFEDSSEFENYLSSLNHSFKIIFFNTKKEKTIKIEKGKNEIFTFTKHFITDDILTINIRARSKNPFNIKLLEDQFSNNIKWCEYDKSISINLNIKNKLINEVYSMIVYEDTRERNLEEKDGINTFVFRMVGKDIKDIKGSKKQDIFKEILKTLEKGNNLDQDLFDFFRLTDDLYDENIRKIFLSDFGNQNFKNGHLEILNLYKNELKLNNIKK